MIILTIRKKVFLNLKESKVTIITIKSEEILSSQGNTMNKRKGLIIIMIVESSMIDKAIRLRIEAYSKIINL